MFVTRTVYNVGPNLNQGPLNLYNAMFRNILSLPFKDQVMIINAIDEIDERRKEILQKYNEVIKKHEELTKKHQELETNYKKTMSTCVDKEKFDALNRRYMDLQYMCESNDSSCTLMSHMTTNIKGTLEKITKTLKDIITPYNIDQAIAPAVVAGIAKLVDLMRTNKFGSVEERQIAVGEARKAMMSGLPMPEPQQLEPQRKAMGLPVPEPQQLEPQQPEQPSEQLGQLSRGPEGMPEICMKGNARIVCAEVNNMLNQTISIPTDQLDKGLNSLLLSTFQDLNWKLAASILPSQQEQISYQNQTKISQEFWTDVYKITGNLIGLDMTGQYPGTGLIYTTDPEKMKEVIAEENAETFRNSGFEKAQCDMGDQACDIQQKIIEMLSNPQQISPGGNMLFQIMLVAGQLPGITQADVPQTNLPHLTYSPPPTLQIGHVGGNVDKNRKSRNNYIGNKYAYFSLNQQK